MRLFIFCPVCEILLSSWPRDQTCASCNGSTDSQPLDRQGSPYFYFCIFNIAQRNRNLNGDKDYQVIFLRQTLEILL